MTGQQFRQIRQQMSKTQENLARLFDCDRKTIERIEASSQVKKVYELAILWLQRGEK